MFSLWFEICLFWRRVLIVFFSCMWVKSPAIQDIATQKKTILATFVVNNQYRHAPPITSEARKSSAEIPLMCSQTTHDIAWLRLSFNGAPYITMECVCSLVLLETMICKIVLSCQRSFEIRRNTRFLINAQTSFTKAWRFFFCLLTKEKELR